MEYIVRSENPKIRDVEVISAALPRVGEFIQSNAALNRRLLVTKIEHKAARINNGMLPPPIVTTKTQVQVGKQWRNEGDR